MFDYSDVKYICYNWMPRIADHILDHTEQFYKNAGVSRQHNCDTFDPYAVKENDIIFVKTDYIINGTFEKYFLNKIGTTFNLITGISSYHLGRDDNGGYKNILNNSRINKWICTNPPVENSKKIIPIPIGFQEPDRPGGNQTFLEHIHESRHEFHNKIDGIFLPYHDLSTNPMRKEQFEYLSSLPFVYSQREKQSLIQYYQSLNSYKFVIGLEGSGPDIHRNYETLLVGSIPINTKNIIEQLFKHHGVEAIFLNDWENLNTKTFEKILDLSFNRIINDQFLKIDYHRGHIRDNISKGV